ENLYLAVVDMHDMRGQQPTGQEPQIFEKKRRASVVFFSDGLCFGRGFSEVNENWNVMYIGEGFDLFEMLRAHGVWRVRRDGGRDQRVAFPTFDEAFGVAERGLPGFIIWRWKINDSLAKRPAKPGLSGLFGDGVLEIIHVGVCRRSA